MKVICVSMTWNSLTGLYTFIFTMPPATTGAWITGELHMTSNVATTYVVGKNYTITMTAQA